MTTKRTTEEEHAYYEEQENQMPTGPPVRRRRRLSEPVPVRFPEALLAHVRERAAADDRSLSSWIRRAVEHELAKETEETIAILSDTDTLRQLAASDAELARGEGETQQSLADAMRGRGVSA